MMKRFIIGAMLILGLCSWVKAQKIDVRIRVVDEWNRPLQGVMMRIGGNDDESFLSDKDGMIECRADKGAELNFEKYNQLQRKLKVTGEVMMVKLDKDNRLFELGYDQRVTKENTTAAIDGVSADEMKLSGEINPLNTLYGLIPGWEYITMVRFRIILLLIFTYVEWLPIKETRYWCWWMAWKERLAA